MTAKSAFGVLGVAVALAPVYFFSFYFLIKIFNVKTPGRDLMVGEARLFTKADYKASKGLTVDGSKITSADDKEEARLAKAATIIEYLGGEENIVDVDSCASRLRLTVVDSSKANIDGIKSLGGSTGALVKGNNIQVVYGGEQEAIKPRMIKILAEQREAKKANMMVENKVEVKVEENKEAEAEVVEEEKVDQEDQIKILQGEVDKWKNDYYKVFADMENIKRRMQNEHANNLKFMMQGFIEQMLPIVDNFERSLAIENPSEEVANFLKGYEMIYKQIMTLLENQGVKVIEAEGKEFDPNFHQAVMTVSDENFKPGMVVEELQKGYMLKDRVIRASLVKVSE